MMFTLWRAHGDRGTPKPDRTSPRTLPIAVGATLLLFAGAALYLVNNGGPQGFSTTPPPVAVGIPAGFMPAYPTGPYKVGVAHRAILINDQPTILMAGCIHYPRSTPSMWPALMRKSKAAGINIIETYVFWNQHEPVRGEWDFSTGSRNLPLFLRLAREHGLYVNLRLGPYVCSEWQYGGFPDWLRLIPGIQFRTWNEPFKREMERYVRKLVEVAAPYMPERGGPVIMMQIENEYGNYQWMYGEDGNRFATWCGELAHRMNSTVPWIMCRQWSDVPHVIPTHNDFYCHHYLKDFFHKFPDYPGMWTENWPGWFQRWGEARPTRPVQDIAYSVARWFASGGSYHAYYMWHGGTNFGRTSGPMVTTTYDYDVMLDEYGLERYPKYHHLQRLHELMFKYQDALLRHEVARPLRLGPKQEAYVYGDPQDSRSIIFLTNEDETQRARLNFLGLDVTVPRWSVVILSGGHPHPRWLYTSSRIDPNYPTSQLGFKVLTYPQTNRPYLDHPDVVTALESIPANRDACPHQNIRPLEQLSLTNDDTDYLWYVTDFEVDDKHPAPRQLVLTKVYEMVVVFVDGNLVGLERGSEWTRFDLGRAPLADTPGTHSLQILLVTMGWTNGEKRMEEYHRGILGTVQLDNRDITNSGWGHSVGLRGEKKNPVVGTNDPATVVDVRQSPSSPHPQPDRMGHSYRWNARTSDPTLVAQYTGASLAWHRLEFTFAETTDWAHLPPLALDLNSMTKGFALVNGHHIGRYWLIPGESPDSGRCQSCDYAGWFNPDRKCRKDCGLPSQRYYHVPKDWLSPPGQTNDVVLFEEISGEPQKVALVARVHQPYEGDEGEDNSQGPNDNDDGNDLLRSTNPHWLLVVLGVGAVLSVVALGWSWRRSKKLSAKDTRGEYMPVATEPDEETPPKLSRL
ncbi:glycosyl hydrolases family 35-domain-containing protein [Dimargaris cristalligena]|uniref:Beta-galactosidase n=1 Tax=Dimargaris cristalligena TaxID=215637 RepID=A0A4P9ZKH0_9FUNG|nr:glycosyl hydrolases family 35-domain-containing protein [Dimargaris cristalligena]|eukprot:RKP33548.1 glycosyl hydrolases family 35-domain-containing protein [Dimargaris cristalligena]